MKARAFAVVLGIAFLTPALVSAQPWTAAGVTAIVDPAYRDAYKLRIGNPSFIAFSDGSEAIDLKMVFNVTDTTATGLPPWTTLEMGVLDNFSNSHIKATLHRVDKCTGATQALCTVTSANSSTPSCWRCTFTAPIDFVNYAYFVEVNFLRQSFGLDLRLYSLRIY